MEVDELLNLEEQFYQEGYTEGRNENLKQNSLEGKQYGLQVGFQRFQLFGIIYGICELLVQKFDDPSMQKNATVVMRLVSDIKMDNNQSNVELYEKSVFKIRNKFRLVLTSLQKIVSNSSQSERLTLEKVELLSKELAGELHGYVENATSEQHDVLVQDQTSDW